MGECVGERVEGVDMDVVVYVSVSVRVGGRCVVINKWKRIQAAYIHNDAERIKALATIRPDPARYNAELFLLGELYPSAAMLSQEKRPVWGRF